MNTESFRGYRAQLPIFDDCCIASLDEIYEIIYQSEKKETIKIIGDTLCIE